MNLTPDIVQFIITSFIIGFLIFHQSIRKLLLGKQQALIVIDMQNDFLEDGHFFDKMKKSMELGRKIIPNINNLVQKFRENNLPVVFIYSIYFMENQEKLAPEYIQPVDPYGRSKNIPLNNILRANTHKQGEITCCAPNDTEGIKIYKQIDIKETDKKIQKNYYSAFRKTELNKFLKDNYIKELVITGVATNYCVTATVIDGFHLGYNIALIEDGVAASVQQLHDKAKLELEKYYCISYKTNEYIAKSL